MTISFDEPTFSRFLFRFSLLSFLIYLFHWILPSFVFEIFTYIFSAPSIHAFHLGKCIIVVYKNNKMFFIYLTEEICITKFALSSSRTEHVRCQVVKFRPFSALLALLTSGGKRFHFEWNYLFL